MTDIDETDAVTTNPETGRKRFRTTQLTNNPAAAKNTETKLTPVTATIALTILTITIITLATTL